MKKGFTGIEILVIVGLMFSFYTITTDLKEDKTEKAASSYEATNKK